MLRSNLFDYEGSLLLMTRVALFCKQRGYEWAMFVDVDEYVLRLHVCGHIDLDACVQTRGSHSSATLCTQPLQERVCVQHMMLVVHGPTGTMLHFIHAMHCLALQGT